MYNHSYQCLFDGSNISIEVKSLSAWVDQNRGGYYLIKTPDTLGGDAYKLYFDEEVK